MDENNEKINRENVSKENMTTSKPPVTGKKATTGVIIAIAAIVIVALLVAALVVLHPYVNQSSLIGKWHLTKEEYTEGNGTYNSTTNQYIEFRADGTGYIYINQTQATMMFYVYSYNITWKERGDGRVDITNKQEDVTTTVTMNYTIKENNITLSYRTKIIPRGTEIKVTLYGERVDKIPAKPDHTLLSWDIKINDSTNTFIHATTQTDGTAKWSGWVNVTVYDENSKPLPHARVSLNGCGIAENETTNSSGVASFYLENVTLPSGVQEDKIHVVMQYKEMSKSDYIMVIRSDEVNQKTIESWSIWINGNSTKVIKAESQSDGRATWSGNIKIGVYDADGNPIDGATVMLQGCGITMSEESDAIGNATFHVDDITLPTGVQQDDVQVRMSYNSDNKTDVITVIRSESSSSTLSSWEIYVNGSKTKVIEAITQTNGTATWSGDVSIATYDQNDKTFTDTVVSLEGCGVNTTANTDANGTASFHLKNITLPAGVTQDEIHVKMKYGDTIKEDNITVIRSDSGNSKIGSWDIYINGSKTDVIKAETQPDGTATWSGNVTIIVYDQNNNTLSGVAVTLQGCEVNTTGTTDSNGEASFNLYNVTLPNGVQEDEIKITLKYKENAKMDNLTVIRVSSTAPNISSWVIYINGNKTKVIKAVTQSDGNATWSGSVKVKVYDENNQTLQGVAVNLTGCRISENGTTNANGEVEFLIHGVTLPSGVQEDEISITMKYNNETKTDVITVIRTTKYSSTAQVQISFQEYPLYYDFQITYEYPELCDGIATKTERTY